MPSVALVACIFAGNITAILENASAFPDQPLIYAALIIGMLVEFPHLIALKHLLLRKKATPSYLTL